MMISIAKYSALMDYLNLYSPMGLLEFNVVTEG